MSGNIENEINSLSLKVIKNLFSNRLFFRPALFILCAGFLLVSPSLGGFLGFGAEAQAAAYTASVSGNWSNSATWGGVDPATFTTSDTATTSNGVTVTVDVNVGAGGDSYTIGTTTVQGAMTLGTNITWTANGDLTVGNGASKEGTLTFGAGSTLALGAKNLVLNNANLRSVSTSVSWAKVTGTGAITTGAVVYASPKQSIILQYVSFQNTGAITFGIGSLGTVATNILDLDNCVFTGNGAITYGMLNWTAVSTNVTIDNCDYRAMGGDLTVKGNTGAATGTWRIHHCTFQSTVPRAISLRQRDIEVNEIVTDGVNIGVTLANVNETLLSDSLISSSVASDGGSLLSLVNNTASGGNLIEDNYFISSYGNPHTIMTSGANEVTNTIQRNVLEVPSATSDPANHFIPAGGDSENIINNLIIGGGSLFSALGNVAYTYNIKNNTVFCTEVAGGLNNDRAMLNLYETSGNNGGTINIANNLVTYKAGVTPSAVSSAADDITGAPYAAINYSDYNDLNGLTANYVRATVTLGTTHDINAAPSFVDPTRNAAIWNQNRGEGTATAAAAIAYLLGINGYNATNKDQSGTPCVNDQVDLISYVRAGFAPTNASLRGTGDPLDGSPDIGAVLVSNTAPSLSYGSISQWNKGDTTIPYTLTDADSDTIGLTVQYSTDNSNWSTATKGTGGDNITGLTSSPSGTSHTFVWATGTDLPTTEDSTVYIKITPSDGGGGLTAYTSSAFGIDNVAPSSVGAPTFGTITASSITIVKPSSVTENGFGLKQWQARRDSSTELGFNATTTTSVISSSLSANTQYAFGVQFSDYQYSTSTYGTSASKYTLAPTPTNLAGTPGATSMALTVDSFTNATAGSSGYYFANTTKSTNSGWIQTNTWSDSGLTCGATYAYTVIYRNGDGTETSSLSLSKSTSACVTSGGGASIPSNAYADYLAQVAKSASISSGQTSSVVPSAVSLLKTTNDPKVYQLINQQKFWIPTAQAFNQLGLDWNHIQTITQDQLDQYITATLIKTSTSPKVYLLENGQKRWIQTAEAFNTLDYDWTKVLIVSQAQAQAYPDGPLISSSVGQFISFTQTLKLGSTGNQVKSLQQYLNTHGFILATQGPGSPSNETFFFGSLTKQALLKYQQANGLGQTGVLDAGTRERMNGS